MITSSLWDERLMSSHGIRINVNFSFSLVYWIFELRATQR